jgi:hypothetical protein
MFAAVCQAVFVHLPGLLCQVIEKSLEAQVLKSDNSSLARDCRQDMQRLNRCGLLRHLGGLAGCSCVLWQHGVYS